MCSPVRTLYIFALVAMVTSAFADTKPGSAVWQTEAEIVCQKLDSAQQAYVKGDMQQAHLNALMAYFQAYDQKIEPAIRMTLGQARVFQTEQLFNKFNTSLVEQPTQEQLEAAKQQALALCAMVKTDAALLDAKQVNPQLYKVNQ